MKITRLPIVALALVAAATTFVGSGQASAQDVRVNIGPPGPPPGYHEHRWHRPGPYAVWIDGFQDWRDGRWIWVPGHWDTPPHRGWIWISGHWRHGYWRPGHWRPA
jgi:hypothetical protein